MGSKEDSVWFKQNQRLAKAGSTLQRDSTKFGRGIKGSGRGTPKWNNERVEDFDDSEELKKKKKIKRNGTMNERKIS